MFIGKTEKKKAIAVTIIHKINIDKEREKKRKKKEIVYNVCVTTQSFITFNIRKNKNKPFRIESTVIARLLYYSTM